jgi:predicted HAD superfamily phosphohydrolase YqeG
MKRVPLSTVRAPEGATVILDIDGTIVPPGDPVVSAQRRDAVASLAQGAHVVLLSNKKNHERNERIARELGVTYHRTAWKKPFLASVRPYRAARLLVVGDKVLTDGLLALFLGAPFILVERLTSGRDGFFDRLACAIDDGAGIILTPLISRHAR